MDIIDTKGYRKEEKYFFPLNKKLYLINRLNMFAEIDSHANEGLYTVSSIYFDDLYDSALRENLDGDDPRSKWRIRIYNHNLQNYYLEKKYKINGLTKKISCRISQEEYNYLIDVSLWPQNINTKGDDPVYKRFLIEKALYGLMPKVIVEYDRVPYCFSTNTVRITLDYNISCIDSISEFGKKNIRRYNVMENNQGLIEVKYDGVLPDFIIHIIQEFDMQRTSNSKYSLCRTNLINRNGVRL